MIHAWLFVGGVVTLWLGGWVTWPRDWLSTGNFLITALVLVSGVQLVVLHETARRFSEERSSGTLEVLLTTPLTPEEIIAGYEEGIREQFRPLRDITLGLCTTLFLVGFVTRDWTVPAVISYTILWVALLVWCLRSTRISFSTAWAALNSGSTLFAMFRTSGSGAVFPWIWILFHLRQAGNVFSTMARFPTGSTMELVFIVLCGGVAAIVYVARLQAPSEARGAIVEHLRTVAQQPIPGPRDPRLSKWDGKEPLVQSLQ